MSASRRRALGLLSVVLGACATGDNELGSSSGQGFPGDGGGTSDETSTTTSANGSDTGTGSSSDNGNDSGTDAGTDGGTGSYGTEGMGEGMGDGGYFEGERSAEDVDLDR